jgi:hypothetical protein
MPGADGVKFRDFLARVVLWYYVGLLCWGYR